MVGDNCFNHCPLIFPLNENCYFWVDNSILLQNMSVIAIEKDD